CRRWIRTDPERAPARRRSGSRAEDTIAMESPLLTDLDALDLLARSSTAAFAIDRHDRIIYWNAGATKLLGHSGEDVLGRFCFDTLAGRDPFGNRYCTKECPILVSAITGGDIEPYLMQVQTKSGHT